MANSKDNISPISYSKIIMNREYGTNSKMVYVNMCNSFGWDKTQIGCFSRGRSLCAVRADKERKRDVWFIYNPNYDVNFTNVRDNDNKPIDTILDDGEAIKEIIPFHYETDHTPERLVFAKIKMANIRSWAYTSAMNQIRIQDFGIDLQRSIRLFDMTFRKAM